MESRWDKVTAFFYRGIRPFGHLLDSQRKINITNIGIGLTYLITAHVPLRFPGR